MHSSHNVPVDHAPLIFVAPLLHLHLSYTVRRVLGDLERLRLRHVADGEHALVHQVSDVGAVVQMLQVHPEVGSVGLV